MNTPPTVAVIGGGFSGLLTAVHLLHADTTVVVRLVEKAPQFGRGRAFGQGRADQLLNVRVANMSAFPDRPSHFQDWLAARGDRATAETFVSRTLYGDYLQSILREAVLDPGGAGRLLLEQDEAIEVRPRGGRFQIDLALGRDFLADAVVLAVGLGPPAQPPEISADALSQRNYVADPWRGDLERLPEGDVLLLGSGLTMVDVALAMGRPGRTLLALSRRGLQPRTHGPAPPAPPPADPLGTPRQVFAALRAHARAVGWRAAVDSIRPLTADLWRRWSEADRRAFLRHLQPWWDVHRHRVSPSVAAQLAEPRWLERFKVLAGRLGALEPEEGGFRATIRPRGQRRPVVHSFQAVVNCTGLSGDLGASCLLADLKARGVARPDALNLGLQVDAAFRLVGAMGEPANGIFAVGPLTRGALWEAVAVPDLRNQTARVAETVMASLAA